MILAKNLYLPAVSQLPQLHYNFPLSDFTLVEMSMIAKRTHTTLEHVLARAMEWAAWQTACELAGHRALMRLPNGRQVELKPFKLTPMPPVLRKRCTRLMHAVPLNKRLAFEWAEEPVELIYSAMIWFLLQLRSRPVEKLTLFETTNRTNLPFRVYI